MESKKCFKYTFSFSVIAVAFFKFEIFSLHSTECFEVDLRTALTVPRREA